MEAWESYLIAGGSLFGLAANEWRWRRRDKQLRHNLRLCIAAYAKTEESRDRYLAAVKRHLEDQIAKQNKQELGR